MSYYISSDVLLANLLFYSPRAKKAGVSFNELKDYCNGIKEELLQTGYCSKNDYISFNMSRNELKEDLRLYPDEFYEFQNRYYGSDIRINSFKGRMGGIIDNVMEEVAKKFNR